MTNEQKAAFINSQVACAMADIEAMKAENQHREMQGKSQAYGAEDFFAIPDRYGISHNAVLQFFGIGGE